AFQPVAAQVCGNPNVIYGMTGSGGLYPIDITNGNVGAKINSAAYPAPAPSGANAIGYNTINGKFYYFKVNPSLWSGGSFISFDPVLQIYTTLATSPIRATVHAGCVNFNGTGYYCTDVNGNLFYYNIGANTWTTITSYLKDQFGSNVSNVIVAQNSGDIAIDGLGNLWIVTSNTTNYGLYEVFAPLPTTPQASVIANKIIDPSATTPSASGFQGVAFSATGKLYLSTSNKLYQLTNKTAASMTYIADLSMAGTGTDLTSCSYPIMVLPVTWSSFTASLQNNHAILDWTIANASGVKGFYVERSNDNKNWNELAYLSYTETEQEYSFTDFSPAGGHNYYRIRETDFNGESFYSEIKMVSIFSGLPAQTSIWPNPAKSLINIQSGASSDSKVQLFDQTGRLVYATVARPGSNQVNISSLAAGNYIVHISSADGSSHNEKLIKK
ncbi:MAG: T9SS type A sorting domain-containing protein, partial [Bacteroidetes bacterium]|nr:T9SS type A sorting domain-containing protein [Bacteroidota bacterium]